MAVETVDKSMVLHEIRVVAIVTEQEFSDAQLSLQLFPPSTALCRLYKENSIKQRIYNE